MVSQRSLDALVDLLGPPGEALKTDQHRASFESIRASSNRETGSPHNKLALLEWKLESDLISLKRTSKRQERCARFVKDLEDLLGFLASPKTPAPARTPSPSRRPSPVAKRQASASDDESNLDESDGSSPGKKIRLPLGPFSSERFPPRGSFAARGAKSPTPNPMSESPRAQELTSRALKLSLQSPQKQGQSIDESQLSESSSNLFDDSFNDEILAHAELIETTTASNLSAPSAPAAPSSLSMPSVVPRYNDTDYVRIVPFNRRLPMFRKQRKKPAVPFGVQYYLAFLVSDGDIEWDELSVADSFDAIRSDSNVVSFKTLLQRDQQHTRWDSIPNSASSPLFGREATFQELETFAELDRETEALSRDRLAGLGFSSDLRYGGQIIFGGRLFAADKPDLPGQHKFIIKLDPPRMGPSCRFTRRFGSERFLRIKLDPKLARDIEGSLIRKRKTSVRDDLNEFLQHPFLLLGRIYRPFFVKDSTIWMLNVGVTLLRSLIR